MPLPKREHVVKKKPPMCAEYRRARASARARRARARRRIKKVI